MQFSLLEMNLDSIDSDKFMIVDLEPFRRLENIAVIIWKTKINYWT